MSERTLGEAREALRESIDEGTTCPCCGQTARRYRRTIHASMASALIVVWRGNGTGYGYVPDSLTHRQNADFAKLAYWGLVEPEPDLQRDDGSNRTGRWRVTDLGRRYQAGQATVRKYALVYNGDVEEFDGPNVSIWDALGKGFDYAALQFPPRPADRPAAPEDEFDGHLFDDTIGPATPRGLYDPETP